MYTYAHPAALNELFTRHALTAEECSEVGRRERRENLLFLQEWQEQSEEWEDRLAQVLLTKPTKAWQEAVQVLEKHGCPVKLKSRLYYSSTRLQVVFQVLHYANLIVAHTCTNYIDCFNVRLHHSFSFQTL